MAISIPQGYVVTSNEPIDNRLIMTKEQMKFMSRAQGMLPTVYFCLCSEKDEKDLYKIYIYDSRKTNAEWSDETGFYEVYKADVADLPYDKLLDKPAIELPTGDKTIEGTHKPDYYGLQTLLTNGNAIGSLDAGEIKVLFDEHTLGINANGELYAKVDATELEKEIARAKDSEAALQAAITAEIQRALGSEGVLRANILNEIQRAKTSEGMLFDMIDDEILRALSSEGQLEADINLLRSNLISEGLIRAQKDQELEDRMVRGIKIDGTTVTINTSADHYIHTPKGSATNYGPVKLDNETIVLNANDKIALNKDDYTIQYANNKVKANLSNVQKKLTAGDAIKLTSEGTYRDKIKVRFDNETIKLNDSEDLYVRDVLWAGPNSTKASLKDIIPVAAGGKRITDSEKINTLVDYDTLVDMISSNLGEFRGTFDSEGALETAYPKGTADKNDYAFVTIVTSEATYYDRYKCVDKADDNWEYEFRIATSGFTAPQWKALQSLATKEDLDDLRAHLTNTNNPHHVTATQLHLSAFENKTIDSEAVAGSINPIASGAVKAALDEKQDHRTFINYLLENNSEETVEWELYDRVRKGTGDYSLVIGDPTDTQSQATGACSVSIGGRFGNSAFSTKANADRSVAMIGGKITTTGTNYGGFAVHGEITDSNDAITLGSSSVITSSNDSVAIGRSNRIYKASNSSIVGGTGNNIGSSNAAYTSNNSIMTGSRGSYINGDSAMMASSTYSTAFRSARLIGANDTFGYNSSILIGTDKVYSNDVFGTIVIGSQYAYTKGTKSVTMGSSNVTNLGSNSLVIAPLDDTYMLQLSGDANATQYTYTYGESGSFINGPDYYIGGTKEDLLKYLIKVMNSSVYIMSNISESFNLSGTTVTPSSAKKWVRITDIDTTAKTIKTASTLSTSALNKSQFRFATTYVGSGDSIVIGRHNKVGSNRVYILGDLNSSSSYNNYLFGKGLIFNKTAADPDAAMALGKWNVNDSSKSFVIGNGTDNANRRNALTIDDDNHVAIVTDPVNDMDVVPYKMLHKIVRDTTSGISKTLAKAERDKTYIYSGGALTSLTITEVDQTGITDIIFKSGSSITVNLPTGVKLPKDFVFEPNKTYEINILDNLALVGTWE